MKRIYTLSIFAVAMAYVESAIVVYLREMLFGNVLEIFPLRNLPSNLAVIEIGREAATIVMLLTVGVLAGRNKFQKRMYFVYGFAIWDIFYYVFLWIMVGWPTSLLNFDILFLIPIPWIGPVLTPVLVSLLLTVASLALIRLSDKSDKVRLGTLNSSVFAAGCAIVLYSFMGQIFHILLSRGPKGIESYVPGHFSWLLFLIGYFTMCAAAVKIISDSYRRIKTEKVIP